MSRVYRLALLDRASRDFGQLCTVPPGTQREPIDAGLTVPQYLGRLAANAATIINARDYGRTVYDLATRRQLILIGEDVVNAAYDSPVDFPPKEQIE